MRRCDIWTVAGGRDYAGKPRPVVIVQDDSFDATDSIRICVLTSDQPLFRLPVEPNDRNGLIATSRRMVDKITIVPKCRVGVQIGRLDDPATQSGASLLPRVGRLAQGEAGRIDH
jgi:mRNA interferase MazF